MTIRLVAPDGQPFPYEPARRLLQRHATLSPTDLSQLIPVWARFGGWSAEQVRAHEALGRRGMCFAFQSEEEPVILGFLFENNIQFCTTVEGEAEIAYVTQFANDLGLRMVREEVPGNLYGIA